MSKKLGFVSRVFPRFSRKMKRLYNEAGYRTRRNNTPYSRSGFLASDLFINGLRTNTAVPQRDAISIILFVTKDNPLKAENMIEERLASEMFEDISPKNRAFFFDTMNSFEELEYTYKKLYEQQKNIQKIWDNAYRIFNENYKFKRILERQNTKKKAINYYIKFLKVYLRRYLIQVPVRSLKVERHVQRIIEKIVFLKFLKHFKNGLTFDKKENFFSYFMKEKRKLTKEFSISGIQEPISNNLSNNIRFNSPFDPEISIPTTEFGERLPNVNANPFNTRSRKILIRSGRKRNKRSKRKRR